MPEDERFIEISDYIDRIVTVDFHTRGFILSIYEYARKINGDFPLSYSAAKDLNSTITDGSYVYMLVGFPTFGTFIAEQDGPVGGAILSRTLAELKHCKIVVFTDLKQSQLVKETFKAAGFTIVDMPDDIVYHTQACVIGVMETEPAPNIFLDNFAPSAVIAVERPGKNKDGNYVSMRGLDLSGKIAKLDELVEQANRKKILTVGIADGGNEIGCGSIREAVERYHPNGMKMASSISTKKLVFASTSNFGAYAVSGALACLNRDLYILPKTSKLIYILERSAQAGLHNGPPLWLDPGTDGVPAELECSILSSIRRMVEEEINPHFPKFY